MSDALRTRSIARLARVDIAWESCDRHPVLTAFATAGSLLAILFAVVGLPKLPLHGPLHFAGVMAPTCGLTRGTVALFRGALTDAVRLNPASPLVLLGGAGLLLRAALGASTGRWVGVRIRPSRLGWAFVVAAAVALAVNQQLHADLLG